MKTNKLSNRKVTTSTGKLPDSSGFNGSGQGIVRKLTKKEVAKQAELTKPWGKFVIVRYHGEYAAFLVGYN